MTLALAIVARRRPWWRRLADVVLGIDRRALAPDQEHSDRLLADEFNRVLRACREVCCVRPGDPPWTWFVPMPPPITDETREWMRAEIAHHRAMATWRARNDGRPAPRRIPSDGMPCSR